MEVGSAAGSELDITVEGGDLRLSPVRQRGRRIVELDGWPVLEAVDGVAVTDADVTRWRDLGESPQLASSGPKTPNQAP